jgi:regulation of enolase protein 1 (concanavalin A-like superfamily)
MLACQNEKQDAGPSRVKSVVPRNYADWDKFDVDKELHEMELEDERRKEQAMKKKQQEKEKKKNKKDEEDKFANAIGMFNKDISVGL